RSGPIEVGLLLRQNETHVGMNQGPPGDPPAGTPRAARQYLLRRAEQRPADEERRRELPDARGAVEHERREEPVPFQGPLQRRGGARLTQDDLVQGTDAQPIHGRDPRAGRCFAIVSMTRRWTTSTLPRASRTAKRAGSCLDISR